MAGSSLTVTSHSKVYDRGRPTRLNKIDIAWTSDDSNGTASGSIGAVVDYLVKGITDPGAAAPDADYDIAITDAEGMDVLANCTDNLADRHTANTEQVYFLLSDGGGESALNVAAFPLVGDELTVSVSNAGNSKAGQLVLYYLEV